MNAFIEAALVNYPNLLEKSRQRARRRQQAAWMEGDGDEDTEAELANSVEDTVEMQRLRSPCPKLEVLHLDYNYIGACRGDIISHLQFPYHPCAWLAY